MILQHALLEVISCHSFYSRLLPHAVEGLSCLNRLPSAVHVDAIIMLLATTQLCFRATVKRHMTNRIPYTPGAVLKISSKHMVAHPISEAWCMLAIGVAQETKRPRLCAAPHAVRLVRWKHLGDCTADNYAGKLRRHARCMTKCLWRPVFAVQLSHCHTRQS